MRRRLVRVPLLRRIDRGCEAEGASAGHWIAAMVRRMCVAAIRRCKAGRVNSVRLGLAIFASPNHRMVVGCDILKVFYADHNGATSRNEGVFEIIWRMEMRNFLGWARYMI